MTETAGPPGRTNCKQKLGSSDDLNQPMRPPPHPPPPRSQGVACEESRVHTSPTLSNWAGGSTATSSLSTCLLPRSTPPSLPQTPLLDMVHNCTPHTKPLVYLTLPVTLVLARHKPASNNRSDHAPVRCSSINLPWDIPKYASDGGAKTPFCLPRLGLEHIDGFPACTGDHPNHFKWIEMGQTAVSQIVG